jgi:hypothetical protein
MNVWMEERDVCLHLFLTSSQGDGKLLHQRSGRFIQSGKRRRYRSDRSLGRLCQRSGRLEKRKVRICGVSNCRPPSAEHSHYTDSCRPFVYVTYLNKQQQQQQIPSNSINERHWTAPFLRTCSDGPKYSQVHGSPNRVTVFQRAPRTSCTGFIPRRVLISAFF